MADRYFTPEEVEALIPGLTRIVDRVLALVAETRELRGRQLAEQRRIAGAGGGVLDRAAWRADSERLAELSRVAQGGLDEIAEMGGVPKDLELGLVDFPHLRDGREVNLCWKYGETRVEHWHGLDEGYANRKPL